MAALDVAAREGWTTPPAIARILAAREAALDIAPVRAALLDRLQRAIADGDVIEASSATVALDTLALTPYFPNASPAIEGATTVALEAAIDAPAIYAHLAGRFTATGRELTDALKKVDPDMSAEDATAMTSQPKRDAWASIPTLCSTLDRLLEAEVQVLHDLGNVEVHTQPYHQADDLLPLAVRFDKPNAETLREIWTRAAIPALMNKPRREPHPGRAGLWGALIVAGAVIEAHNAPHAITRWPVPTGPVRRKPEYATLVNRAAAGPKEGAFLEGVPARREAAAAPVIEEPVNLHNPALGTPGTTSSALRGAAGLE